jgi:hypothetical protein
LVAFATLLARLDLSRMCMAIPLPAKTNRSPLDGEVNACACRNVLVQC